MSHLFHKGDGLVVPINSISDSDIINAFMTMNIRRPPFVSYSTVLEVENSFQVAFFIRDQGVQEGKALSKATGINHSIPKDIYWVKNIHVYNCGDGLNRTDQKHYFIYQFRSCDDGCLNGLLAEAVSGNQSVCHDAPAAMPGFYHGTAKHPKKGEYIVVFGVKVNIRDPKATDIFMLTKYPERGHLLYVPRHFKYSDASPAHAHLYIQFPDIVDRKNNDDLIEAFVTEKGDTGQAAFEKKVYNFIVEKRKEQRWESALLVSFSALYDLQLTFPEANSFSEATRRLVFNYVVHAASVYCNDHVKVEENLWESPTPAKPRLMNVAGHGPLDYYCQRSNSNTSWFSDTREIQFEKMALPLPVEPNLRTVRIKKLRRKNDAVTSEPSLPGTCILSRGPSPLTTKRQAPVVHHTVDGLDSGLVLSSSAAVLEKKRKSADKDNVPSFPSKIARMFGLSDEEEIEEESGLDLIDVSKDAEDNEDEEKEENVGQYPSPAVGNRALVEAKNIVETNSLMQMAIQMHDAMLERDDSNATLAKTTADRCYGNLTSAQTNMFFRLDCVDKSEKPVLTYLGTLWMPYFVYKSEIGKYSRISGAGQNLGGRSRVSFLDFENVVAATVMMMEDEFNDTKA